MEAKMRARLSQVEDRAPVRTTPDGMVPVATAPTVREIPYDYVAKFILQGNRGNREQSVINVSVEGSFVAVAVAYSFIPNANSISHGVEFPSPRPVPEADSGAVMVGHDDSPELAVPTGTVWTDSSVNWGAVAINWLLDIVQPMVHSERIVPPPIVQCLLARLCGIDFKYSIIDSGSGRELQNQPVHNIAGLGKANGERPFRPMAKPMLFMPRSTIRIEVEEISEGPVYTGAELYIVLHGYKILGYGTGTA
jgi:hypothetical protein